MRNLPSLCPSTASQTSPTHSLSTHLLSTHLLSPSPRSAPAVWSTKKHSSRSTLNFFLMEVSISVGKILPASSPMISLPFLHLPYPLSLSPLGLEFIARFFLTTKYRILWRGNMNPVQQRKGWRCSIGKSHSNSRKQVSCSQKERLSFRDVKQFTQDHTACMWQTRNRKYMGQKLHHLGSLNRLKFCKQH